MGFASRCPWCLGESGMCCLASVGSEEEPQHWLVPSCMFVVQHAWDFWARIGSHYRSLFWYLNSGDLGDFNEGESVFTTQITQLPVNNVCGFHCSKCCPLWKVKGISSKLVFTETKDRGGSDANTCKLGWQKFHNITLVTLHVDLYLSSSFLFSCVSPSLTERRP